MILSKIKDCITRSNEARGLKAVRYTFIPLAVNIHGPRKTRAVYGEDFMISMDTYYKDGTIKDRDIFFGFGPIVFDMLNVIIEQGGYADDLYVSSNGVVYDNEF
jgi:hypothetical protein